MNVALGLFAMGAVSGLYLAVAHFRGRELKLGPALAHGAFGAAGLAALALTLARSGFTGAGTGALGLFTAAALGGFFLFSFHLRGKRLPSPVVVVHALAAVAAFALLAGLTFGLVS